MKQQYVRIITWIIAALLVLSLVVIPLISAPAQQRSRTPQFSGTRTASEGAYSGHLLPAQASENKEMRKTTI